MDRNIEVRSLIAKNKALIDGQSQDDTFRFKPTSNVSKVLINQKKELTMMNYNIKNYKDDNLKLAMQVKELENELKNKKYYSLRYSNNLEN